MKKILLMTAVISIGILFSVSTSMATFINPVSGDPGQNLQVTLDALVVSPSDRPLLDASGVDNDALANDAFWTIQASGAAVSTFVVQITGYENGGSGFESFGIFDATNLNNKVELFAGGNSPGSKMVVEIDDDGVVKLGNPGLFAADFGGKVFGFYISTGGVSGLPTNTFYSLDSLNSDGNDHMVAFQGNGKTIKIGNSSGAFASDEYIFAFEDLPWTGNLDGSNTGSFNSQPVSDRDYNDTVILVESIQRVPVPEPATMLLLGLGLLGVAGIRRKFKSSKS